MKKTYAPHLTALLSGAGAVLTVIHPGFKIPVGVQGLVASLCVLASAFVEVFHIAKKSKLESNLALATHLAGQFATAATQNVAAETTTTK